MFSTPVSKIHWDLCIFTVVYNSIYPLFYGWIVILFPAFCYYEQSVLFCFSPAPVPFRTFCFPKPLYQVSQCLQGEIGFIWVKRTSINQREWWGLVNWRIQDLAKLKWIVVATWECRHILPELLTVPNWKSGFLKKCKIPYYLNSL